MLAACLLTDQSCQLDNVPRITDVETMVEMLRGLGAEVGWISQSSVQVRAAGPISTEVSGQLAARMRASFLLLGPLLGRCGRAVIPRPGGDDIGMRRVEQHIIGLRSMGASIDQMGSAYRARAETGLTGAKVILDMPTVTGTENLLMAAVLARGRTVIVNAAREPHVQDLARFLNRLGAQIKGAGSDTITVAGVEKLGGGRHRVVTDYIEAGTYAIAAVATGGDVLIRDCRPRDLVALTMKLERVGASCQVGRNWLRVRASGVVRAVDLTTWPHPGFATDLQAPYLTLMTQARGSSMVSEAVFENRFRHVPELIRMGARITQEGRSALIDGPCHLQGGSVVAPDIRSGAALVVAALCASGYTEVHRIDHLDRGYQDLVGKLRGLGADIRRLGSARDDLPKAPPSHVYE